MDRKPTLYKLRAHYGFNTVSLANAARISPDSVYAMLRNLPVRRIEATNVLKALTRATGRVFSVETVTVVLEEEGIK